MYSIAKIHYTTITMNKEGTACFAQKRRERMKHHIHPH